MTLPAPFPVARYRLHAQVQRAVHWPEYEGSALRGLWGHALRRLACATGRPLCEGCPLAARCAYPALFEPEPPAHTRSYGDLTPPYVIEPPATGRDLAPGQPYAFELVLFGRGLHELPLVLRAWRLALASHVGPADGALRLERIEWTDPAAGPLPVSQASSDTLGPIATHQPGLALPAPDAAPARARLELLTPLFVKRGGRSLAPHEFSAADLLWALVRRVAEVCELHLGEPTGFDFQALKAAAQQVRFAEPHWQIRSYPRWSNRQRRHTPLAGIVGRAVLDGPLAPFWPLLHLGQWLHAGGKTSFGLGRIRVEPA
jgi:hypothetical protein